MIDPQAKPASYIKLLAYVVVLGLISALITFAFIFLVNQATHLLWTEAAQASGMDTRLFTLLVCTVGGLLVGLLVKLFGDHTAIFSEIMLEFGKTGRFDYRNAPGIVITAIVSLAAGGSLGPEAPLADACGGVGTLAADRLKLDDQETRTMGYAGVSGMLAAFITAPFSGALLGLESAQGDTSGRKTYFWVLLPSLLASAVATVVFVMLSGSFFETLYQFPGYSTAAGGSGVCRTAGHARWGGWRAVHAFAQTPATTLRANEDPRGAARVDRRAGHGHHRRAPAADVILGRSRNVDLLANAAEIGVVMLLVLGVVKLFATSLLLATGWKGGYIFPLMFTSVALGLAVNLLFPAIPVAVTVAATMAGALVAALRAPFPPSLRWTWCRWRLHRWWPLLSLPAPY